MHISLGPNSLPGSCAAIQCYGCPKNDTIILPKYIDLPISYIKSGKWEDCLELCQLFDNLDWDSCNYFNFYSSEFDGDLKNYCIVFSKIIEGGNIFDIKRRPMKGVISGALTSFCSDYWNEIYKVCL